MNAEKKRRILTETQMLSIVESTEAELLHADEQLGAIAHQVVDGMYTAGMFSDLVKRGCFTASTINVHGKPAFILIHCRNDLGWLMVEGAVALGNHSLEFLFDGGETLARHFNAPIVVFVTKLTALYRYATAQGYQTMGVILFKKNP
ncbi:MAG TPA: hypothetical protein VNV43_00200 [Candidatus Acidoferrales bacterium]|jgi:hypothetical protein|nr:hypothetical protein [Candidatus Acidoferrales bacterium]